MRGAVASVSKWIIDLEYDAWVGECTASMRLRKKQRTRVNCKSQFGCNYANSGTECWQLTERRHTQRRPSQFRAPSQAVRPGDCGSKFGCEVELMSFKDLGTEVFS